MLAGFRSSLKLNPAKPDTLAAYGYGLANMEGDVEGAQEMYKRALAADPKHVLALTNYALLLRDRSFQNPKS